MMSRILGVLTKSACAFCACLVSFLSGSPTVSAAVLDDPPGYPVLTQEQIDAFYNHPGTQAQRSLSQSLFGANTQTLYAFGTIQGSLVSTGAGSLKVRGNDNYKVIYVGGEQEDLDFEIFGTNLDIDGNDRTAELVDVQSVLIGRNAELYTGVVGVSGPAGLDLAHSFVLEFTNDQGSRETRVFLMELIARTDWAFAGDPLSIDATDLAVSFETAEGSITVLFEDDGQSITSTGEIAGIWPSRRKIRCAIKAAGVALSMLACIGCTVG